MANKASPTHPDALSIQLLGRFRVAIGSRIIPERAWSSRKAARLVKLLALAPNHCLHREQITDLLWPEQRQPRGKIAAGRRADYGDTLHPGIVHQAQKLAFYLGEPRPGSDVDFFGPGQRPRAAGRRQRYHLHSICAGLSLRMSRIACGRQSPDRR